jgi:coenzyme F420-reducing hydrogenase gamma subunit
MASSGIAIAADICAMALPASVKTATTDSARQDRCERGFIGSLLDVCTHVLMECERAFDHRDICVDPNGADSAKVPIKLLLRMREALERTHNATPDPKWVVAVGDCAVDGGIFSGTYAVVGGVSGVVPVDLHIRGCPPQPTQLLKGLLTLLEPT